MLIQTKRCLSLFLLFILWFALPVFSQNLLLGGNQDNFSYDFANESLGKKLEDFPLIDQDGNPFQTKELLGKPFIVTFIYTNCPVICPNLVLAMEEAVIKAGSRFGVEFLALTVVFDVEEAKPEILRSYGESFTESFDNWIFVSAESAQTMLAFTKQFGFQYKKAQQGYDHLMLTSVVGKDGIILAHFFGQEYDPDEALKALKRTTPVKPGISPGAKTLIYSISIALIIFLSAIYFFIIKPIKKKKDEKTT